MSCIKPLGSKNPQTKSIRREIWWAVYSIKLGAKLQSSASAVTKSLKKINVLEIQTADTIFRLRTKMRTAKSDMRTSWKKIEIFFFWYLNRSLRAESKNTIFRVNVIPAITVQTHLSSGFHWNDTGYTNSHLCGTLKNMYQKMRAAQKYANTVKDNFCKYYFWRDLCELSPKTAFSGWRVNFRCSKKGINFFLSACPHADIE